MSNTEAMSFTPPAALATPCAERTFGRSDSLNGGCWTFCASTVLWGTTLISMPLFAVSKMRSNEWLIVSVKT